MHMFHSTITSPLAIGVFTALFLLAACSNAPESTAIVFESYRDGNAEVYMMDANGENLVNLTQNPDYDGTPDWSPDGQHLTFTSERDGAADIYVMAPDGSQVERLTHGEGSFNVIPAWSPDGTEIAFSSNRTYTTPGEGGHFEIEANTKLWSMLADGSDPVRRTSVRGLDMFATWSPDGQSIAYMSVRDDNLEIYMLRSDDVEINLSNHPDRDTNPAWSPDGAKIAFMSDRSGDMEIYIMQVSDRSLTNITNNPANDGDPAWSPDGSQLLFISDRDGNGEIYVMDSDGSNVKRLTNHPAEDIHPQWQPVPLQK